MHQLGKFLYKCLLLFCTLFIVFFPIPNFYFQQCITSFFFKKSIVLVSKYLLHWPCSSLLISSDSRAMYILCLLLFCIAFILLLLQNKFSFIEKGNKFFWAIIPNYYLIFILWQYGWDKITYAQFYTPPPNILYTTIGNAHLDTLYWSTIGLSKSYCVFLGVIELVAGMLLIFRKTKFFALVLCIGIFVNVVAVNFCFDINVKLFSSYLLLLTLLLFLPYCISIYTSIQHNMPISFLQQQTNFKAIHLPFVKTLVLLIMIFVIIFPFCKEYFDSKNKAAPIYGGYHIADKNNNGQLKNIFLHPDNYIILQNNKDEMIDKEISIDTITNFIVILKNNKMIEKIYFTKYSNQTLQSLVIANDTLQLEKIQLEKLNAMQKEFHWAVDDY
jgi:hypothetical protein